jgi:branched-chain amino acid transport system permease protein
MEFQIALMLVQDGITNGAIYALLALALVLVFAVTRVIFIPQGEFVAYGALTLAALQAGVVPATVWLLVGARGAVTVVDGVPTLRSGRPARRQLGVAGWNLAYPLGLAAPAVGAAPPACRRWPRWPWRWPSWCRWGRMMYRLAFQPMAEAPVLVLLIVAVAVHLLMVGLGLLFFGAGRLAHAAVQRAQFELGPLTVGGQTLVVVGPPRCC